MGRLRYDEVRGVIRTIAGEHTMPNGAQALMRTLVDAGVTVCFSNPGTSEMHFVARSTQRRRCAP